ncbi:MAG: hypothetical protein Kow00127_16950 [Bacteroidales bacterium]
MQKRAILKWISQNENIFIYVDESSIDEISDFLESKKIRREKFRYVIALILIGKSNKQQYGPEGFNDDTKYVTAIKCLQGSQNFRIYCQELIDEENRKHIILVELLEKKKVQKQDKRIRQIIKRVAGYNYDIGNQEFTR